MSHQTCPACGRSSTGRFCSHCGTPVGGSALARREQRAWRVAGVLVALSLLAVVTLVARDRIRAAGPPPSPPPEAGAPAPTGAAAPVSPADLSALPPRERFDRLYASLLQAAQTGDRGALVRMTPIAFQAYAELPNLDADARYHAAVLELHVRSNPTAALRLADTILAEHPRHLFGFLIRGTAAQLGSDALGLQQARAAFLAAWEAETKAARPEYRQHQGMLEQFRSAAEGQRGRGDGGQ